MFLFGAEPGNQIALRVKLMDIDKELRVVCASVREACVIILRDELLGRHRVYVASVEKHLKIFLILDRIDCVAGPWQPTEHKDSFHTFPEKIFPGSKNYMAYSLVRHQLKKMLGLIRNKTFSKLF